MKKIAIVRDPLYLKHSNGPGHPEGPERLRAIDQMLAEFPLRERLEDIPARDAIARELAWIHRDHYIKRIERTREGDFTMLDPDTMAGPDSYAAAVRAAGGTMEAVSAVLDGHFSSALALVRPPGHHAEADRAMGFCLFNNVAVGACHALNHHGLERVLIVDWDVHQGNGTMHSFYDSSRVMYCSVHQYPHYPGIGRVEEIGSGPGTGYTVNVPLRGGQGDADYLAVFRQVFQPVARDFAPQLILISAGFDAHTADPLASMRLSSRGYAGLTAAMMQVAEECCGGRLVVVLEGGYDLSALAQGIAAVLRTLIGEEAPEEAASSTPPPAKNRAEPVTAHQGAIGSHTAQVIREVVATLKPYWKSLA